jgi:hypothetical protein
VAESTRSMTLEIIFPSQWNSGEISTQILRSFSHSIGSSIGINWKFRSPDVIGEHISWTKIYYFNFFLVKSRKCWSNCHPTLENWLDYRRHNHENRFKFKFRSIISKIWVRLTRRPTVGRRRGWSAFTLTIVLYHVKTNKIAEDTKSLQHMVFEICKLNLWDFWRRSYFRPDFWISRPRIKNPRNYILRRIARNIYPKFQNSKCKGGENTGYRQTDGRNNDVNRALFFKMCSKNV